jgi:DNA-binding CsgD family transcriptional regulator
MRNNITAFNKIHQTIEKFNAINKKLEESLGLRFGYTALFKDGSYYKIQSDIECIEKIVSNIDEGVILCDKNVSNSKDEFSYLLWPERNFNKATEIFSHHGYGNSISLISEASDRFDVFYFSGINDNKDWKEFFTRNKKFLREYVQHFRGYAADLLIDDDNIREGLFYFKKGINLIYPESQYIKEEQEIYSFRESFLSYKNQDNSIKASTQLAPRELEVFNLIVRGYSAKSIASDLNLASKTIQHYIENIKKKLQLNTKHQLIKYYEQSNKSYSHS